jgi:hypothetical protein
MQKLSLCCLINKNCRGIRCVCVLKEKTKMFTGFDDVCENLSCE